LFGLSLVNDGTKIIVIFLFKFNKMLTIHPVVFFSVYIYGL